MAEEICAETAGEHAVSKALMLVHYEEALRRAPEALFTQDAQ
jgi:hypothetical protein